MRLKFIQITTLQDKALATKRPEMRDKGLAFIVAVIVHLQ
jgi:hypothetical protein